MLQHFYCGGMISVTFNDRSTAQKHTLLIVNSKEIISTLALRFSEANVWRLKSYIKIKKGKLWKKWMRWNRTQLVKVRLHSQQPYCFWWARDSR